MAIFRLSSKIISRSRGQSSTASAAYRSGEKINDKRLGKKFNYRRKQRIYFSEILLPKNAPREFFIREKLWNAVEEKEKRKDAQLSREITISLPKELTPEENITLVQNYCHDQFILNGMCVDTNYHDMKTHNPHVHLMNTLREVSKVGFGNKNRSWNDRKLLKIWRKKWARYANEALIKAGHKVRIDHRSNKDQGLSRIPTRKIGASATAMERRGIKTFLGNKNRIIKNANDISLIIKNNDKSALGRIEGGWRNQKIFGGDIQHLSPAIISKVTANKRKRLNTRKNQYKHNLIR